MKTLGSALALALLLSGCSARGQSSNPLLGKWKAEPNGFVGRDGFQYCKVIPEMDFAPASQTMYMAGTQFRPPAHGTTQVQYLVAGNKIYVSSTAGFAGAPMYTMLGPNEMQESAAGGCKYTRM